MTSSPPPAEGGAPGELPLQAAASSGDGIVLGAAAGFSLASPYAVKVPSFEGPLDLLLHLIRINEVEITDIPVALIAEQYIESIEVMRELNLDVAGEYLLMAATLAWIKSRMLLPPDGVADEDEGPDPRAELVARLLEYQRFKEVSAELGDRHLLGRDVFRGHGPAPEAIPDSAREIEVGVFALVEAYKKVLARPRHTGKMHQVEVEAITVRDRMIVLMETLDAHEAIELEQLITEGEPYEVRLPVLVATFLAMLELVRLSFVRIYQGTDDVGVPMGPIHCRRHREPGEDDWKERVSDWM